MQVRNQLRTVRPVKLLRRKLKSAVRSRSKLGDSYELQAALRHRWHTLDQRILVSSCEMRVHFGACGIRIDLYKHLSDLFTPQSLANLCQVTRRALSTRFAVQTDV